MKRDRKKAFAEKKARWEALQSGQGSADQVRYNQSVLATEMLPGEWEHWKNVSADLDARANVPVSKERETKQKGTQITGTSAGTVVLKTAGGDYKVKEDWTEEDRKSRINQFNQRSYEKIDEQRQWKKETESDERPTCGLCGSRQLNMGVMVMRNGRKICIHCDRREFQRETNAGGGPKDIGHKVYQRMKETRSKFDPEKHDTRDGYLTENGDFVKPVQYDPFWSLQPKIGQVRQEGDGYWRRHKVKRYGKPVKGRSSRSRNGGLNKTHLL